MKALIITPLLLVAFLAGPLTLMGQNEKKINRELRKIEKHSKKLQELQGINFTEIEKGVWEAGNHEEIAAIREEAMAQADEQREEVREAMEQQREAMQEAREAMRDQKREMERSMVIIRDKNAKEMDVVQDFNGKKWHYYYHTPKWDSQGGEKIVMGTPGNFKFDIPELKGGVYNFYAGNQDNLSINRNLADESSAADFNYEVKPGATGLAISVNGEIEAGKVKIVIKRPDGELYNEYTLSSLANVNWKQNLKFEDLDEAQYVGKWMITVTAEKAKGTYRVDIRER